MIEIYHWNNYSPNPKLSNSLYFKSGTSSRVNDRKEDREKRRAKEPEIPSADSPKKGSPKKPKNDKPRNTREDTYITLRDGTRKRVEKKEVEATPPPNGKNTLQRWLYFLNRKLKKKIKSISVTETLVKSLWIWGFSIFVTICDFKLKGIVLRNHPFRGISRISYFLIFSLRNPSTLSWLYM